MRKKKNCWGCRALTGTFRSFVCGIGYDIEEERKHIISSGMYIDVPKPKTACPKPLTYKAYFDCLARPDKERKEG